MNEVVSGSPPYEGGVAAASADGVVLCVTPRSFGGNRSLLSSPVARGRARSPAEGLAEEVFSITISDTLPWYITVVKPTFIACPSSELFEHNFALI